MQEKDILTISNDDASFPDELNRTIPPVSALYITGNKHLLSTNKPKVAIVGTRKPSAYGIQTTKSLAAAVSRAGGVIISGLAYGIDSIAHRTALEEAGLTVAVLPSCLTNIYPRMHETLANQIVAYNGLLISEYKEVSQPMKHLFIARNRIIAALADVIVVPEGEMTTGSRHTIEFGIQMSKKIAAVPGRINDAISEYPNHIISQGCTPILNPQDLLDLLGINETNIKSNYQPKNTYEDVIINELKRASLNTEMLLQETKLDVQTFNIYITMLEIRGIIERSTDGQWQLA